MPELPEVESVRRFLETALRGRSVNRVDSRFPGVLSSPSSQSSPLLPAKFQSTGRRGKMLAIRFDRNQTLMVHLRMTGRLYFPESENLLLPHTHVLFHLNDGRLLGFCDPRRFGRLVWHVGPEVEQVPEFLRLGPDALTLSREEFIRLLYFRDRRIKPLLLDQSVLAGMGNIYVDETLFRSGIHPNQRSSALSKRRLGDLWESMVHILEEAINNGGSTIRDFVGSSGEAGNYQKHHSVYGRGGKDCVKCGELLRRIVVAQRGTTYCPRCQRLTYRRSKAKAIKG